MKKIITSIFLIFIFHTTFSQLDTATIKLDLLRAPSSPGANLLGFAPSDIEKPSDVTDFMATLQSTTSNFTVIPSNYAIDIAPFWALRARNLTISDLNSRNFMHAFRQSFVISTAIRNPDSTSQDLDRRNFYNSFGIKFSLLRGRYNKTTVNSLESITSVQEEITSNFINTFPAIEANDSIMILLRAERDILEDSIAARFRRANGRNADEEGIAVAIKSDSSYRVLGIRINERTDVLRRDLFNTETERLAQLKTLAKDFKIERVGPFIDFAGGISLEYVNRTFNKSRVYNAGAWLTFGHNGEAGLAIMGLVRYLYNPDKVFADDAGTLKRTDISTLDGGLRALYSNPDSRFSFSSEAIYRSVLEKDLLEPSWRLVFNTEYDIGVNQKLTFSFGRAFNGTITKDGNVIAALNFLKGFGGKR